MTVTETTRDAINAAVLLARAEMQLARRRGLHPHTREVCRDRAADNMMRARLLKGMALAHEDS